MAYTDAEIDLKIANLQTEVRQKSPASDLSEYAGLNSTRVQSASNSITALEASVTDLQKQNASLANRLLTTQTVSFTDRFEDPSTTGDTQVVVFQTPAAMNISTVKVYRDGGSDSNIQILNDAQNVLTGAVASIDGSWAIETGLQNIGTTNTGSVEVLISDVTGAQTLTIQVDLTV